MKHRIPESTQNQQGWVRTQAGRIGDMHPALALHIQVLGDNDIVLQIRGGNGEVLRDAGQRLSASIEFCNLTNGGGRSPNVRNALQALIIAMQEDAKKYPDGIPAVPPGLRDEMLNTRK